jgi:hypothetical protein
MSTSPAIEPPPTPPSILGEPSSWLIEADINPDFSFALSRIHNYQIPVTNTYAAQRFYLHADAKFRQLRRGDLLWARRSRSLTARELEELDDLQSAEIARLTAELRPGTEALRRLLSAHSG